MIDFTAVERAEEYLDVSGIPRRRMALRYRAPDGSARRFDLYHPTRGQGPFPVIVSISGGGWYFGHPTSVHLGRQIHTGVARGYAVASLSCTSSREQKFPYQIHEINGFLRHLRQNAADYELDMDFAVFLAASSGAHLALLTALTHGDPFFDPAGDGDTTPAVKAVGAIYPCCRLNAVEEDYRAIGLEPDNYRAGPRCAESIFLGVENVHDHPDLIQLASPTFQIRPDAPPVMVIHGMEDTAIPYTLSLEFARRYREIVGTEKILTRFLPGVGHSHPCFKDEAMCGCIVDFLDRVRLGQTPCPPTLQNTDE